MKCPHCGREIDDRKCPSCGSGVLRESLFCHRCGEELESAPAGASAQRQEEDTVDFSKRILCSDGNCIGVINEQGFCKVCGKPYAGESQ